MDIKQLIQEKHDEIYALVAKYGVYNVRIFGSLERGEDRTDSNDVPPENCTIAD